MAFATFVGLSGVAFAAAGDALGETVTIAPGVDMPSVNLGTCCGSDPKVGIEPWLKAGGVGIDTSIDYLDQEDIGMVLKQLAVPRESIFITSKVPGGITGNASDCAPDPHVAVRSARDSLQQLGVDYLDLLLLHFPCPTDAANAALWEGMKLVKEYNLSRAIGVSNFNPDQIDALPEPVPSVNQCHLGVTDHDDEGVAYHKSRGIQYEAWSPLRGCPFDDATVNSVADSHGVTAAQVCLRFVLEKGVNLAVGTGHNVTKVPEYTKQNLDVFSFSLTDDEMIAIDAVQPPGGMASNPCRRKTATVSV